MTNQEKTHYRKAFNSPYLSSADIVEPTTFTISHVTLERDKTKKSKDLFNTAYFVEKEIRAGEALKPMILNATNSRTMKLLTGTPFIEDWADVEVTIYVDHNVKNRGAVVDGLRISTEKPRRKEKQTLTKGCHAWKRAVEAVIDGNLDKVTGSMVVSDETLQQLKDEAGVA